MKIFYVLIFFVITFYFLRIFKRKIRIKKQFDNYLSSLKQLKNGSKTPDEAKIIFDKVSFNGIKLICYGLILLLPYLFFFITLFAVLKNYSLAIIFSSLSYFSCFYFKK